MEPKIGVYICHCGANIADIVDIQQVVDFAKGLDSVVQDAHEMGLLDIVRREGDMDLQGRVIRKLMSNPRTFLLGLKAVRYINPFL